MPWKNLSFETDRQQLTGREAIFCNSLNKSFEFNSYSLSVTHNQQNQLQFLWSEWINVPTIHQMLKSWNSLLYKYNISKLNNSLRLNEKFDNTVCF